MAYDLISVVCATYNNETTIRRCIESINAQNYPNIEIIIHDCGSTDATVNSIKSCAINVDIVCDTSCGQNEGLRKSLQRASGRMISVCSPFMIYLPGAFEEAINFFHTNRKDCILCGDVEIVSEHRKSTRLISYHNIDAFKFITDISDVPLHHYFIYLNTKIAADEYKIFKNSTVSNYDKNRFAFLTSLFLNVPSSAYLPRTFVRSYDQSETKGSAISVYMQCLSRVQVLGYLFGSKPEMKEISHKLRCYLYQRGIEMTLNAGAVRLAGDLQSKYEMFEQGMIDEYVPLDFLKEYADEDPSDLYRFHRLALALVKHGRVDEALSYWEKTKPLSSDDVETMRLNANLLSPSATSASLLAVHGEWYSRIVKPNLINYHDDFDHDFEGRRIRVGYVCTYWSVATIRFQLSSWLKHHDTSRFEIFAYYRNELADDMPDCIEHYRHVTHLSGQQFINMVREDRIDILVEVNGFTLRNFFTEMASRCAPVQVSYLNYTSTCGIPSVDFIVGDDIANPPSDDSYFTEKIYRLPGCFFCFSYESEDVPYSDSPPSEKNGYVTFGCFGSGGKFNRELVGLWSKLLEAVPNSILVLQNNELTPQEVRRYYTLLFAEYGIAHQRIKLLPGTDRNGILESYKAIDISLDTWPYCGGNTIAESLWCGVPVVTLKGARFSSRYGASLLHASGCDELIAESPDEYIRIAAALAHDRSRLGYYRKNLRSMMHQYGFSDTKAFAAKMEKAYLNMLYEKKSTVRGISVHTVTPTPEKLLSVVMYGRNDNFRKDYVYRIETAINFLADTLKELDSLQQVEIIMVDAGSGIPFSEVLQLSPEAAEITKFLYVSQESIDRRSPRKSLLYAALLANAGIRRASGRFVLYTDVDCMIPLSAIDSLLNILRGENKEIPNPECYIFNLQRFHLPRQLVRRKPSVAEWRRLLPFMGGCFRSDYLAANTFGGNSAGHVLARDVWHQLRGFDEEMTGDWGWHDDALMMRVSQTYGWINLITFGIYSFHMEHEKMAEYEHTTSKTWNPTVIHGAQAVNGDSWGLGDDDGVSWQRVQKTLPATSPTYLPLSGEAAELLDIRSIIEDEKIISYLKSEVLPLIHPSDWQVPLYLQDVLPVVVEFARHEAPLSMITYGEVHPSFLMTVVKCCPALELFFCQPWPPGIAKDESIAPPGMFMWVLEQAEYKGHARIILGDLATSIERSNNFRHTSNTFEMAFIDVKSVDAELHIVGCQLLYHIVPGGMIVFSNINSNTVDKINALIFANTGKFRLELVNYDHSAVILFKLPVLFDV